MQNFDDIPEKALKWCESGHKVALATVVETWGSAPRPVGSMMCISEQGDMWGSVSGGCVESAVVQESLDGFENPKPKQLEYGVSDMDAFAAGLACGGKIKILLQYIGDTGISSKFLNDWVNLRKGGKGSAYMVNLITFENKLQTPKASYLADWFNEDRSGYYGDWFIAVQNPPLKMFVIGAVHIAQPLLQMARMTGFETTLIDPRSAFASSTRFPNETIEIGYPDEVLSDDILDHRSAVVTLAHDPKIDDPAIEIALGSNVFYIGCLGSKKTHAKRLGRFQSMGFTQDSCVKIHGPVGADIGAKTPAEIAVSIMAEVIERLRKPQSRR